MGEIIYLPTPKELTPEQREHWEKTNSENCDGKKAFSSYRLAAEWNNHVRKRGSALRYRKKKLEKLHVYKCRKCQQFHIGHAVRTNPRFRHQ